ncbi:protein translocase subunit SecF [Arsenophonus symbiont of Ornithomya chloropus]|uniref:protein translocase subunit SecF n=1 Tax=Arsenophonus symbiont of Ornithomya chloropus TaxID=634121 RepID=UPI0032B1BA7D
MLQNYTVKYLNKKYKIIDFMSLNYFAFSISIVLLIISLMIISLKGFYFGLDFTGGTVIEITFSKLVNLDKIRENLMFYNHKKILIQYFGNVHNIIIRIPPNQILKNEKIDQSIISIINKNIDNKAFLKRVEFVGPSVGDELIKKGLIAILSAFFGILIYVSVRFEWRLAFATVITLIHDVIFILGILSLFKIEFDMTIIASLMSVIGYSLNDSIVIFDRIRENFHKMHHISSYMIVNISLTQTLKRTLITSISTLLVISMLYIFGGVMLKGFSLVFLIGVIIGSISSIYVASALVLIMGIKRKHLIPLKEDNNEYFLR